MIWSPGRICTVVVQQCSVHSAARKARDPETIDRDNPRYIGRKQALATAAFHGDIATVPPLWRKFDGTQRVSTLPCEHPGVLKLLADFPTSLFECV